MSKAPGQDRDAKKPRILQKFLLDYTTDLKPFMKVATFCYCCTCWLDFSIGHGGRNDCKRHAACKRHKEYAELWRTCPSVSSVFKQKETPLVLKTTRAETLLVTTLMDSNLPLSAAEKNSWKPSRKCFQTLKSPGVMHSLVLKTTRAETLLVTTLVDSNLPLLAAEKNSQKPSGKCFQTLKSPSVMHSWQKP